MSADYNSGPQMKARHERSISSYRAVKRVIGVTSSKGGVGTSFVTGLLASELIRMGARVGILDADFTGSCIPLFFGLKGPLKTGEYSFLPLQTPSGIKVISVNFLLEDETQVVIWKDALVGKVVEELFNEVEWGELDYLLIDLPVATSEVCVSIMRAIPFDGVVVVTQPQALSTKIVARTVQVMQKIGVDMIGIVENMSCYLNAETDKELRLFGSSSADSLSAEAKAPVLSRIPFKPEISALCDAGKIESIVLAEGTALRKTLLDSLSKIRAAAQTDEASTLSVAEMVEEQGEQEMLAFSQEMTHAGQYFSDVVIQLIRNRDNMGTFDRPDAQGHFLGKCGDRMQIDLQLVGERILGARFLADGCGATLACGSMITKMACSKTLKEAEKIKPDELIVALDGLPEDHLHCAELAVMTLREAIIDAIEGHGNSASRV